MKTALRKLLPLLLCLILCLSLAPAAWAEDEALLIDDTDMFLTTEESLAFEADIGESLNFSTAGNSITVTLDSDLDSQNISENAALEVGEKSAFEAAGEIVTVNFDANGGVGTMTSQNFVRGDAARPLNPNAFIRDGYFFLGWNERADGTASGGRIIKNGADVRLSETSSSSTLTLYAQWKEIGPEGLTVTVSFDANGGTGTMAVQDFVRGDVLKTLNPNTFTRDSYIFTYWNTEADDSGISYQDCEKIAPVESMTLYAQWTNTVLVHYDPNGASGSRKMQNFTLGVTKKLASMERIGYVMDGYDFVGWAPVPDAEPDDPRIIPDGGEFTADEETWIYAIWKKVPGIAISKTNFPDDTFRSYVSTKFDQNGDGELSNSDIAAVMQISVSGRYREPGTIKSLEGVQYFTELQTLSCSYNQLTALDLTCNTALTSLDCNNNQLTALDITNNTVLTSLDCDDNQLTSLDVSSNTALTSLDCSYNQLTALDLTCNTALTSLDCSYNQLTALDLTCNTALTSLSCNNNQLTALDISNNTLLTHLRCDSNSLSVLDVTQCPVLAGLVENTLPEISTLFNLNRAVTFQDSVQNNAFLGLDRGVKLTPAIDYGPGIVVDDTMFPDPIFLSYVKDFDIDCNGVISETEFNQVSVIFVDNMGISSLKGIELFPNLTLLSCKNNQLTNLDITHNTALSSLQCEGNRLKILDLSMFPEMSLIYEAFEPEYIGNVVDFYFSRIDAAGLLGAVHLRYDSNVSVITAPGLTLPASLTEIGEEAFAGNAFCYAIVPNTVTSIGPRAFADCPDLAVICIPENVTEIASDAFDGISDLNVVCTQHSAAYNMVRQYGFGFIVIPE